MKTKHATIQQDIVLNIKSGALSPHERLPSEKDMASQFGVSVGTVVRALDMLTREGWLIRRRGSGTFVSARSVGAPTSIAFVVQYATNVSEHVYFGPIFSALCDACFRENIPITIGNALPSDWSTLPDRYPNTAFQFVSPPQTGYAELVELWRQHPKFVVIGASWDRPTPFPTIDSDNRSGARRAVEYLMHLGHERIVYVNGEADSANCEARQRGYEEAFSSRGLRRDAAWSIQAGSSMEMSPQSRNALSDQLLSQTPPTAIFCAGYFLALEVIELVRSLGLTIPDQISIIAVDDPRSAQHLSPPLTTLRQPLAEIGTRGAERLIQMVHNGIPKEPWNEMLPVELITRGSCAPPKND